MTDIQSQSDRQRDQVLIYHQHRHPKSEIRNRKSLRVTLFDRLGRTRYKSLVHHPHHGRRDQRRFPPQPKPRRAPHPIGNVCLVPLPTSFIITATRPTRSSRSSRTARDDPTGTRRDGCIPSISGRFTGLWVKPTPARFGRRGQGDWGEVAVVRFFVSCLPSLRILPYRPG